MKLLINKMNGRTAHIDVVSEKFGALNIYGDEDHFWTSEAPIESIEIKPSGTYDDLTDRAREMLGSDWVIKET